MRTKRPIRDDGRVDYTIRRTKKKDINNKGSDVLENEDDEREEEVNKVACNDCMCDILITT